VGAAGGVGGEAGKEDQRWSLIFRSELSVLREEGNGCLIPTAGNPKVNYIWI
jgi:hypothetical protein